MSNETSAPPRFNSRQRWILVLLLGAEFLFAADYSILTVALPEVGAGVGLDTTSLAWIVSAYTLPAAGFMLVFGRFADFFGRRRLFMVGLIVTIGASLLGGFAVNPEMLLAARVLQGLATAVAVPAGVSLITTTFAEGSMRERALGLNGAILSGGFTAGALFGGILVSALSWRAAFFYNVPLALVVLLVAPLLLSESRVPDRVKLDLPAALTVTGGLLAVVYAVIERDLLWGVVGAALLVAFWVIEMRPSATLAPVRILKRPTVKWGNFGGVVLFSMMTGMIFLMTLYLQNVLNLSPLVTGLVFGIPGLTCIAAGPIAGRIIGRIGARTVLAGGLTMQGLMILPLVLLGADRIALAILMPALFLGFFVHVTCIVAYTVIGTSGLPNEEQGLATGLTSMTQQVGLTIGAPIMVSIAATQTSALAGTHLALGVNVAVTMIAVVLVWFGLRPRVQQDQAAPEQSVPVSTS